MIKKFFKTLLDLIYNKSCYFCSNSEENSVFCSKCFKTVEFLDFQVIKEINGNPLYAVSYYEKTVQKLIRAVKFHGKKELADFQAEIMYNYWKNIEICKKNYTVIPVPMFYSKARKRNYNHMDLVGKRFCELTGYKFDKTSLIRNRETVPQYKLSVKEREENLKDAFSLVNKELSEPVLIIDDISTTGTTLKEIIKVLNKNDIFDITCFVTSIAKQNRDF